MASKGLPIAITGFGVLMVWSAIQNVGILAAASDLIRGQRPTPGPNQLSAGSSTTSTQGDTLTTVQDTSGGGSLTSNNAANKALGQQMATSYGWGSGAEWIALNNIVMAESGWNDTIVNSTSTASGIAQNINGWSADYQEGNAPQQIAWLLSYIKSRYGDPIAAWQFHLIHGWY